MNNSTTEAPTEAPTTTEAPEGDREESYRALTQAIRHTATTATLGGLAGWGLIASDAFFALARWVAPVSAGVAMRDGGYSHMSTDGMTPRAILAAKLVDLAYEANDLTNEDATTTEQVATAERLLAMHRALQAEMTGPGAQVFAELADQCRALVENIARVRQVHAAATAMGTTPSDYRLQVIEHLVAGATPETAALLVILGIRP